MADLFSFPNITRFSRRSKPDEAPSVAFESDTVVDIPQLNFSNALPETNSFDGNLGDWSNQELADLYRVEAILLQAGIRLSTARGLSDEGDPWYIFCREDDDVFVHLARIDGAYVLDSPVLSAPLQGDEFTALIDGFVDQVCQRSKARTADNVLEFPPKRLRSSISGFQPSILLAALVWTLYLGAEDVATAAELAAGFAADSELPADSLMPASAAADTSEDALLSAEQEYDFDGSERVGHDSDGSSAGSAVVFAHDSGRGITSADRTGFGFGGLVSPASPAAQAVSASLAVIAFSFGFYGSKISPSDSTQSDSNSFSLSSIFTALRQIADSETAAKRSIQNGETVSIETDVDFAPVALARFNDLGPEMPVVVETEVTTNDIIVPGAAAQQLMEETPKEHEAAEEASSDSKSDLNAQTAVKQPAKDISTPISTAEQSADTVSDSEIVEAQPAAIAKIDDAETDPNAVLLAYSHLQSANRFKLEDETIRSTLEEDKITALFDTFDAGLTLDEKLTDKPDTVAQADVEPVKTTDATPIALPVSDSKYSVVGALIGDYDANVDNFVMSFIKGHKSIEIVHFQTELVIIDMDAIDDANDVSFARSWLTDDGHVISTVGHYQSFIEYGMS